jgi:hypothetical protein
MDMRVSLPITLIVLAGLVVLPMMSGCGPAPLPTTSSPAKQESKPKRPAPGTDEPLPAVVDIDPASLEPAKKAHYDKGYSQGQKIAEAAYQEAFKDGKPSDDKIASLGKEWSEERDLAIKAAIQKAGPSAADAPSVLIAHGRKAGFKDAMAKHNISM